MIDHNISLNKKCPCSQKECPIRGNCVLCVQNHLAHKRHIPECIQNLLRPDIEKIMNLLELEGQEKRPDKKFWDNYDKEKFIKSSIDKHE